MASVVGIVFANMNEENLDMLTKTRAAGSVPFGGRYRMIDFILSSMVNSGINKVGVITSNNYQSLMDHIGTGKEWDLARKNGGLVMLPPYGDSNAGATSRIESLQSVSGFIDRCTEEYVVLSDCDVVYNMDFDEIIAGHEKNDADITMVYHKGTHDKFANRPLATLEVSGSGKVLDMAVRPTDEDGVVNQYIKVIVMKKSHLQSLVNDATGHGRKDLLLEVLYKSLPYGKTYAYEYKGYYAYMNSVQSYFASSMEILKKENRDLLFNGANSAIYTKVKDSAPTKYGEDCEVKNSFIADGCEIMGTVENSIIFRGVKVLEGAVIKDSIIMQDGYVGKNASLNCIVGDKDIVVKDGRILAGCAELPYFIGKGRTL